MTLVTFGRSWANWWRSGSYVADGYQPSEDSFAARLPSELDGACFDARFAVGWRGRTRTDTERAWLRRWLPKVAADIAVKFGVDQVSNLENVLNHRLRHARFASAGIELTHVAVQLGVPPEARQAGALHAELKRQMALEKLRHETELAQLRYLREEIFSQPWVARSYWLKHHPEALDDLLDDRFERIAEKLGKAGDSQHIDIARLIEEFLIGLDDDQRGHLLTQLNQVFVYFDRPDLSERLSPSGH